MKFKSFMEAILASSDEGYGFKGTMSDKVHDDHLQNFWNSAFELVRSKATAAGLDFKDVDVRNFLDSRLGRHFADQVKATGTSQSDIDKSVKDGFNNFITDVSFKREFQNIVNHRDSF